MFGPNFTECACIDLTIARFGVPVTADVSDFDFTLTGLLVDTPNVTSSSKVLLRINRLLSTDLLTVLHFP